MFSWSSSTALQRIFEGLEEQRRIIEQLKVYLEERVSPFHRHIGEHRRNIDQALRHLEVWLANCFVCRVGRRAGPSGFDRKRGRTGERQQGPTAATVAPYVW